MKLINRIKDKLRTLLQEKIDFPVMQVPVEKLGTDYGGWTIPSGFLHKGSVCYLAGAGEDISFDVEIAEKYGAEVYIIDPTPRARVHFDSLLENTLKGLPFEINKQRGLHYHISKDTLPLLHYVPVGLWSENKEMKFFKPRNEDHVSHSLVNLQRTEDFDLVPVRTLGSLMVEWGHTRADLLKIDIEGAEYEVLRNVIEDGLDIGVLCVEFDEVNNPLDNGYIKRIKQCMQSLLDKGYVIIDMDHNYNSTFVQKQVFDRLSKES